ncbi:hypothetical protein QIS74_10438 [Colletotrichum tabaci]|uniref:Uncharacterized protein n=1 Tax=Colletotrichum tabaci TaxID=1209068 RepID=A0AAV9T188_9PEZI
MPEPSQQPKSASAAQSNEKTQESKKPQDKCFFGDDECEHNVSSALEDRAGWGRKTEL